MRYTEARGTLIYEKNLKSEISCQTPFKVNHLPVNGQLYMHIPQADQRTTLTDVQVLISTGPALLVKILNETAYPFSLKYA